MSVLVYTETENGKFKKNAFEVASYGKHVADQLGVDVTAIAINAENPEELGTYGVSTILHVSHDQLNGLLDGNLTLVNQHQQPKIKTLSH